MGETSSAGPGEQRTAADDRRRRAVVAGLVLLSALVPTALSATESADEPETSVQEEEPGFLERRIGDNWVLSPIIAPLYSPETQFALVLGGVATFSTEPKNEELPRSTLSMFLVPASIGSLGLSGELTSFWRNDRLRFELEVDYDDGTSHYWPVGYDFGREIEEDEDVTEFERVTYQLPFSLSWRVRKSLFAGLNFDLVEMEVDERSPTQEADPRFLEFGDEILSVGAGFQLSSDTRDDTRNAYSGHFFNAKATVYRDSLGSDQDFEAYEVDFRRYHQIERPGRTVAWQLFTRVTEGDVPWIRMTTVGSSEDLRGYTEGRFRDLAGAWGLAEYRHMTDKELWRLGPQGFVVWGGIGFIGDDLGDVFGNELPNVGVGYRVEIQDRRSIRMDVGFGYSEVAFYLNFTEAF